MFPGSLPGSPRDFGSKSNSMLNSSQNILCLGLFRFELKSFRESIGSKATVAQALDLVKRRQRLRTRVDAYATTSQLHLPTDYQDFLSVHLQDDAHGGNPENERLPFPSAFPTEFHAQHRQIRRLAKKECKLREGQANDSLQKVREAVTQLSWQFKGKVRTATTTKQTTRAWDGVHILERELATQRSIYNHSRNILVSLSDDELMKDMYQILLKDDCQISKVITEPNARGESQKGLAWFWKQAGVTLNDDRHMMECKLLHYGISVI